MVAKDSPVIIVGGGAWGLSTALHMTESGYTNITVYERATQIPSPYSAAWDINKIVRAEYEDPFYTKLALVRRRHLQVVLKNGMSTDLTPLGSDSRLEDALVRPLLSSDWLRRRHNRSGTIQGG
jgi:glycine/D-amino acid oxidase-like deaminating enzyme